MNFDFTLFLSALGLAFMLEGLPYILFPEQMRRVLQQLDEQGAPSLRRMGLTALCLGLLILWLARGH